MGRYFLMWCFAAHFLKRIQLAFHNHLGKGTPGADIVDIAVFSMGRVASPRAALRAFLAA